MRIAAGIAVLALLGLWVPSVRSLLFILNGLVIALALVDLWLSPRPSHLIIEREAPRILSVGASHRILIRVHNSSSNPIVFEIYDHPPSDCTSEKLPVRSTLSGNRHDSFEYRFVPNRRGTPRFFLFEIRIRSRLGLWGLTERRSSEETVRVYPNLRTVETLELLVPRNRNSFEGLKVGRLRGEGGEFDRLREYRRDDELRRVDWKASAKHLSLVSREYRIERNQHVLILLDCGRTMGNVGGGMTHLDRALGASVVLSHLALGQGDYVSLVAFSDRIERSLGPIRGKPAIQTLLQQTFDLEPRQVESDYQRACEEALRRQRRRALVILLTHALDEQHLRVLEPYARLLSSSHLMLLLLIEDTEVTELAESVPVGVSGAFATGAAAEMVRAKKLQIVQLRRTGARVFETVPETLSPVLVNQYLELKAHQAL